MKKYLILLLTVFLSGMLFSIEPFFYEGTDEYGLIDKKWYPFQLALVTEQNCHLITNRADIYGIALGLFVLEQHSATFSASLTSVQHKNYGIQCATVTMTDLNYGLNIGAVVAFIERNFGVQIGFVNVEADGRNRDKEMKEGAPGLQVGVFNIGQGFQIGALNYNTDAYISVLPIFNFSK